MSRPFCKSIAFYCASLLILSLQANHPGDYKISHTDYSVITLVVLVHELAHAVTKHFFSAELVTPLLCGPKTGAKYGESGFLVEEALFGGVLFVEMKTGVSSLRCISAIGYKKNKKSFALGKSLNSRDAEVRS